jgi:hypothetical protein
MSPIESVDWNKPEGRLVKEERVENRPVGNSLIRPTRVAKSRIALLLPLIRLFGSVYLGTTHHYMTHLVTYVSGKRFNPLKTKRICFI